MLSQGVLSHVIDDASVKLGRRFYFVYGVLDYVACVRRTWQAFFVDEVLGCVTVWPSSVAFGRLFLVYGVLGHVAIDGSKLAGSCYLRVSGSYV